MANATKTLPVGRAAALAGLVSSLRQGGRTDWLFNSGDLCGTTALIAAGLRHESTIANQIGVELATPVKQDCDARPTRNLRLREDLRAVTKPPIPAKLCGVNDVGGSFVSIACSK